MASRIEVYPSGTKIVQQDAEGDCMYFVHSGKVRIYRTHGADETVLGVVGPGEVFGEMAVFDRKPRSASAQAIEDTEVRVIGRTEFDAMQCDPVIRQVLKNMATRLNSIDKDFERLSIDSAHRRDFMSNLSARREWAL